jgi:hypothetical protein
MIAFFIMSGLVPILNPLFHHATGQPPMSDITVATSL